MTDVVDKETRSRMMSGIKGKNTKQEILIRKELHKLGFRYKLNDTKLPGKPDIVLPKYNAVIFVNGCFWHGHDCYLFKWPASHTTFWKEKINKTKITDKENYTKLGNMGWRVLIIWECVLRGKGKLPLNYVIDEAKTWILSDCLVKEIPGEEN